MIQASSLRAILTLLVTVAFTLAPQITPNFKGYDPALFPVTIPRPSIQPVGWAFAIWGVIFTWLIISALWGLRQRSAAWDRPRPAYITSVLVGSVWLAVAGSSPLLAEGLILLMWGTAVWAFLAASPVEGRWLWQAPLGLYAGWLTAAQGVSLGVVLAGYGWLGDTTAALLMLALVLGLAILVQRQRPTMPAYCAAVTWAAMGIAVVNWRPNPTVAWAALAGALLLAAVVVWGAIRPRI